MAKKKQYTPLGKKIAGLVNNQAELSQTLGLSQQSVSLKLRGRIKISVDELETLSRHYDVPMLYFLTPEGVSPDKARTLERFLAAPTSLSELLEIASTMPETIASQLVEVARALDQALKSTILEAKKAQGSFDAESAIRRHVLGER